MKTFAGTLTVGGLLAEGRAVLAGARVATAARDAEWLLAATLGADRLHVLLNRESAVTDEIALRFRAWLERRVAGEPLQYIVGFEEFRGLRLRTASGALIPRPETEWLVEWALQLEQREGPWRVAVDVGAGSGAIACALAAACSELTVVAVERSPAALALLAANVRALGLHSRVRRVAGDLLEPLRLVSAIDLVISNPPYIPTAEIARLPREVRDWEPREALDGGPDGMGVHRRLLAQSTRVLRRGGWLLMEMGERQAAGLASAMQAAGFERIEVGRDLAGAERMIGGRKG